MQQADSQWAAWAEKKLIYSSDNFIDVGGKLEVKAPEPNRKKQRAGGTMEPMLFHDLPELSWSEMLEALSIPSKGSSRPRASRRRRCAAGRSPRWPFHR